METNKLVINADKTQLVIMGTIKLEDIRNEVCLVAGQHIIHPSETEKILGCTQGTKMERTYPPFCTFLILLPEFDLH